MSDTRAPEHGSLQPPPQPPRMNRSQPQLATVYAPGAMFTWEGGKGACIAAPVEGAPTIDFSSNSTRREQIFETMTEYCESWLQRGLNIQRPVPVYGVQLLDGCFYSESRTGVPSVSIASDRFDFFRPDLELAWDTVDTLKFISHRSPLSCRDRTRPSQIDR